jgi:chromate transport protein ChrA
MNLVYAILAIISYRYEKTRGRHEYLVGLVVGLAVILLAIPFKWEEAYPLIFLFLLGLSYGFVTRPAWSMIGAKLKWKKDKTSKRLSHIYHKLRKVLPTFHG